MCINIKLWRIETKWKQNQKNDTPALRSINIKVINVDIITHSWFLPNRYMYFKLLVMPQRGNTMDIIYALYWRLPPHIEL